MNCIFCKIIDGEIPSYTLYEDDYVKVILDANPVSNGHSLVIPKKHTLDLSSISNDELTHVFDAARIIKNKLEEKLNTKGCTLVQNNGLGQEVKHYHLHLIPRYDNDNIELKVDENGLNEIDEVFKALQ